MAPKADPRDIRLFEGRRLAGGRTLVMGIVNVTNDSFYAASRVNGERDAAKRALGMAESGADIIDVGAESTRPGSSSVGEETEAGALVPAIRSIRRALPGMPISADTRRASVAEAAIGAGADVINDVSGLELPEEAEKMASLAAKSGAAYVLTHTKGTPDVMQLAPGYGDLMSELRDFFAEKINFMESLGLSRRRILIDPGIGFGKRASDNLTILANLNKFFTFGLPVLIGASRKSFIGSAIGGDAKNDPAERLEATLAVTSLCAISGVNVVRVHDVAANRRAVDMVAEIARHRI
jgi:dihydropteroate synthase